MKLKSIALFLILLIGLSPVSAAFALCGEMDEAAMARQLTTDSADHSVANVMQQRDGLSAPDHQQEHDSCLACDACLLHLSATPCLSSATRHSAAFDQSSDVPRLIQQSLFSTFLLPELRPPIEIL